MTENKYEKAFYEWVRLGDKLMGHMISEDVIPSLDLYREKAVEFEAAFPKAEKWDRLEDYLTETGMKVMLESIEELEKGEEE